MKKADKAPPAPHTKAALLAGLADGTGILARIADDEPVFLLRAQDQMAPGVIGVWCHSAEHRGTPKAKVAEAYDTAAAMRTWQEAHGGGKVPD